MSKFTDLIEEFRCEARKVGMMTQQNVERDARLRQLEAQVEAMPPAYDDPAMQPSAILVHVCQNVASICQLMDQHKKIAAIKELRHITGAGLNAAHAAVEAAMVPRINLSDF